MREKRRRDEKGEGEKRRRDEKGEERQENTLVKK